MSSAALLAALERAVAGAWSESAQSQMHYLIIERFRDGDPAPVYRRFRDNGRLAPDGLNYVGSWVTE
jgi:hypothetical protein